MHAFGLSERYEVALDILRIRKPNPIKIPVAMVTGNFQIAGGVIPEIRIFIFIGIEFMKSIILFEN
jgi:hypothetical protein